MANRHKRVVLYLRVSSERQAESGLGLDAQRHELISFAVANGFEIVDVLADEGISGAKSEEDRPALKEALQLITANAADALVTCKRDRLSRDADLQGYLATTIERSGAELIVIDEVDASPVLRIVMTMVAQIERELARQRTKAAMRALRAQGRHCGNQPFGFEIGTDGKLQPKAGEVEVVQQVASMRREGRTLREIAEWLTIRGVVTRRGGRWSPEQVRSMLLQAEKQNLQS